MRKGTAATKDTIEKSLEPSKEVLSPLILDRLRDALVATKLTKTGVEEAVEQAIDNYKQALVEPGEAAGIVSAQSIGEPGRSEEHTSELQSLRHLVCRLLLEKKKKK